jgi:hypothetical protein
LFFGEVGVIAAARLLRHAVVELVHVLKVAAETKARKSSSVAKWKKRSRPDVRPAIYLDEVNDPVLCGRF